MEHDEHIEHTGHAEGFWDILTDPDHMAAEVVSDIFLNLCWLVIIIPLFRLYTKRMHTKFDKDHNINHEEK